jgi:DNA ligase-1
MAKLDNDGDVEEVQGSGAKPYVLKNVAGVLSCSCPHWRNQGGAINVRTCKHLKKLRGEAAEAFRVCPAAGGTVTAHVTTARTKTAAPNASGLPRGEDEKRLFGCACERGQHCDVAHDPAGCACEQCVLAEAEYRAGRKLRQDEKAKLFGPPIMKALALKDFPDLDVTGYWTSEKLDGVRAYWDGKDFITSQGNVYHAPDWFKAGLPDHPLDGELWMGRKMLQKTISVVKSGPSERWRDVTYLVFDQPAHPGVYEQRQLVLQEVEAKGAAKHMNVVKQQPVKDQAHLRVLLDEVLALGGEGLMLCKPGGEYVGTRSRTENILKVKQFTDAEAVVIAHNPGKGKHKGRLGGLEVRMPDGKTFSVGSGIKDSVRRDPPKVGATITYRFTETTNDGIPKCASFVAVRDYE